jgi:hypothetical protein
LQSWASLILPNLDQGNVYNQINYSVSSLDPVNRTLAATVFPAFRCPSFTGQAYSQDPLYTALTPGKFAIRNYTAISASTFVKAALAPDGVIYSGSKTTFRDIPDGSSNTFLIVETREQNSSVWIDGTTSTNALVFSCAVFATSGMSGTGSGGIALNATPFYAGAACGFPSSQSIDSLWGPSSQHVGGAHHLMGDGAVRFVSQNVDVNTYVGLTTRAGGETIGDF